MKWVNFFPLFATKVCRTPELLARLEKISWRICLSIRHTSGRESFGGNGAGDSSVGKVYRFEEAAPYK